MLSKEEIEQARSNILRGNDIESAALILEAMILDNYIEIGGRVNILKVATRQVLNFIEENKNKGNLDYIKEKVKANNRANELETNNKNLIEKLEEILKEYEHVLASEESAINLYSKIKDIVKGEKE